MPQEPLRRQRIHHSRQPRLAWNEVHWAHADRRVLRRAADGRLAGHIGAPRKIALARPRQIRFGVAR